MAMRETGSYAESNFMRTQAANMVQQLPSELYRDTLPPVTGLQAAQNALDDAAQLAARVETLVERLIGAIPQAVSGQGKDAVAGSVSRMIHQTADYTADRIRSAHEALNRLDSKLP